MKYNDQQFIELALQYKYLTQADVDRCLEIQKKLPGQVGIGEIMRSHKHLEDAEYNIIITLLKYKTAPAAAAAKLPETQSAVDSRTRDRHFAEVALREGLITEEQLKECVELQKKLAKEGQVNALSDIMLGNGYLSEKQVEFLTETGAEATSQYKREDVVRVLQDKNTRMSLDAASASAQENLPLSSLLIRQKEKEVGAFPITKTEITIGRVQGADLVVNDCYVSRIHCKLIYHEQAKTWELIDMMSCHGVFINNVRVSHRQSIKRGDLIRVGETTLEVR